MMHNDSEQKCPLNELPVSPYDFMIISIGSFVKKKKKSVYQL